MDLFTAMVERHSVRSYTTQPITDPVKSQLQTFLKQCNQESGLHMQLILDEPQAFDGLLARYGNFKNVRNYIALVGRKSDQLPEQCGYYGEKLVLFAQTLGLRTCWVGASYRKRKSKRKSQESQLPLKSEGCNKSQGFRGNCDSQGKLGMCPSLAEPHASGFPRISSERFT